MRCPDCGFILRESICFNCGGHIGNIKPTSEERLKAFDSLSFRKYTSKQEIDKAVHKLEGLMKGIVADKIVNLTEIEELIHWYYDYKNVSDMHPFSELIPPIYHALLDNELDEEEIQNILWLCSKVKTDNIFYDMVTSDIQRLEGILHGILSDNEITAEEIRGLKAWLNENEHLSYCYPYDEVYSLATSVLSDGVIDPAEKKVLKAFFSQFVDVGNSKTINAKEIAGIKQEMCINGVCAMTPDIVVRDKHYCFTGASAKTSRQAFAKLILSLGGYYADNVSSKVDYLVVGNEGNPCWAFSCYGRKVEHAVDLRKKGHRILIVHENDFWDSYQDISY
jgi:NAD-dependent DNA ligase